MRHGTEIEISVQLPYTSPAIPPALWVLVGVRGGEDACFLTRTYHQLWLGYAGVVSRSCCRLLLRGPGSNCIYSRQGGWKVLCTGEGHRGGHLKGVGVGLGGASGDYDEIEKLALQ